jgi:hypothetical protein
MFGNEREDEENWYGNVSWGFSSKKDPRFKGGGYCNSLWEVEKLTTDAILELEKKLGVTAPDDIEYGGMKT